MVNTARFSKSRLMGGLGVVVGVMALCGCGFNHPDYTESGHEIGDHLCSDGLDNDGDGLIDCEDPDCIYWSHMCGEYIPMVWDYEPEPDLQLVRRYCQHQLPTYNDEGKFLGYMDNPNWDAKACTRAGQEILRVCHDGIDNDGDGQFDCGTPKCSRIMENCCSKEFTNETCSDGIDNDRNGFVDCADFSCRSGLYVTVCSKKEQDLQKLRAKCEADCRESKKCREFEVCKPVEVEAENTLEKCTDGIDNDGNGYVDCADFSCTRVNGKDRPDDDPIMVYCAEIREDTMEKCTDGIDNDYNGYTDCADNACKNSSDPEVRAYCDSIAENTLEKCSNGKDDDGNGYTDCADFSCSNNKGPEADQIKAYCDSISENTLEKCSDGKDNDGNGYTDCEDHSCSRSPYPEVVEYCKNQGENTYEKCTDGIDNDGNGYTDCEDYSCSRNEDVEVRRACEESAGDEREANEACRDGIDNDMDGFIDCDDWDCSHNPLVVVCDFIEGTEIPRPKVCE